ncbi:dipeptide ABC transporter permease DppC, partial [Klebsiella pneumoniae]
VGLVYVVVMIVIAVFANFLAPYNPADQFRDSLLAPPFWQDGGRLSLLVGCLVVVLSLILGVVLGLVAGYFGGVVDSIIMRVVDI